MFAASLQDKAHAKQETALLADLVIRIRDGRVVSTKDRVASEAQETVECTTVNPREEAVTSRFSIDHGTEVA